VVRSVFHAPLCEAATLEPSGWGCTFTVLSSTLSAPLFGCLHLLDRPRHRTCFIPRRPSIFRRQTARVSCSQTGKMIDDDNACSKALADRTARRYWRCCWRTSFVKLVLLSVGLSLSAFHASAQEVWPGGDTLPDALPPTALVSSSPSISPSPSSVSAPTDPAVTATVPADQKPSIIWHRVDGRWHWHCVAHCSKYRRHYEEP